MRIACLCFSVVGLFCSVQVKAVNPPQWDEFSKGEFIDTANMKTGWDAIAAYVRFGSGNKQVTTLYEVDCRGDRIRVHSDTPRYRRVPVDGGGSVIQTDDGFRTVTPGSRNARIERAICGAVAQREAERLKQEHHVECERATHEDLHRVLLVADRLTKDEVFCLTELALERDDRPRECDKAGVPPGTGVTQYLHGKGIFLECESH